ncbi:IS3 family transposase [Bacillus paralicheniformis]
MALLHLKTDSLYLLYKYSWQETQRIIGKFIIGYNTKRIQLKLEKLIPVFYRDQLFLCPL